MRDTLLVELLTEELPPKSLARLGEVFKDEVVNGLVRHQLTLPAPEHVAGFATPRRLAVLVREVEAEAPDRRVEEKLMPVAVALDAAGNPSTALLKKLEAKGISVAELPRFSKRMDGKSETFYCTAELKGAKLAEVLAGIVSDALKKLPVAKTMRWGAGEAQFVRPVHGLVLLHGSRIVPGSVLGLVSGRASRGHRFMSGGDIDIADAASYEQTLEHHGSVIPDFTARREMIRGQLDAAAGGRQWLEDAALLDEVTALVEHPTVYEAGFDEAFLQVPQECLILTMKANQKYFPLFVQGKLTNRFLLVSNMRVTDPTNIISGNARVVRPRLADAKFFYDQDRKKSLADRVPGLAKVVYHNKLGSQGERSQRVAAIASAIGARLGGEELARQADQAALLSKADLISDMVGEFPELQGVMGRYYALHDGLPTEIANAIEDHYKPRFAGDSLPRSRVGVAVALADKLETLVGLFGIGQVPTGDKDPFALRRHALGVIRMLVEQKLDLPLAELIAEAEGAFAGLLTDKVSLAQLPRFVMDRLNGYLRGELGYSAQEVEATLGVDVRLLSDVVQRLEAVRAFAKLPEAEALAAANKRIVNILKKTAAVSEQVDLELLREPAEQALHAQLTAIAPQLRRQFANADYEAALLGLAGLRGAVDAFFDAVMVMVEEPAIRQNRLALLGQLAALMNMVADISKL